MMYVDVSHSWRVLCHVQFELPVSVTVAWGQLRDFRLFAAQDFFHTAVRVDGGVRQGATLEIDHRFGPLFTTRAGRILKWDEGIGYSFSDLSRAVPGAAFPHVYRYRVRAAGPSRCVIDITIAGRWTTRWLPRPLVRLWLLWVFSHIAASVRNTLISRTASSCTRLVPAEQMLEQTPPAAGQAG